MTQQTETQASPFYIPMTAQTEEGVGNGGSKINITAGPNADANIDFLGKKFIDDKAVGAVLPALDLTASPADSSFFHQTSGIRMDPPTPDEDVKKQHNALSHFLLPIDMFDFVGPDKDTYLSPYFRTRLGANAKDPMAKCPWKQLFFHCNSLYKKNMMTKQEYELFTKGVYVPGSKDNKKSIIPSRRTYYAMNVYYTSTKETQGRNSILLMGITAYQQLRGAINEYMPATLAQAGIQARDSEHPTYFFGDITKKEAAVLWDVIKEVPEGAQTETNLLNFGGWKIDDAGARVRSYEAVRTMPLTDKILEGRKVLHCLDYWDVPTPQDIVDVTLAKFKDIPYDWVAEACGDFTEVIPNGNATQFATGAQPAGAQAAPSSSGSFVAPTLPDNATPQVPEREFWHALPGQTAVKIPESQAKAVAASNPSILFQDANAPGSTWQTGEQAGLVAPTPVAQAPSTPPVQAPVAQPESEPQPVASAPEPEVGVGVPMPAQAQAGPSDDIPLQYSPKDNLTPEENQELARIEAEYESAKATQTPMNPADVKKRAELLEKAGA